MNKTYSYKISDSLFLVRQEALTGAPPHPQETSTDHVFVLDCSGSMAGSLPAMREQINKKLVSLMKDDDTVTIIWFSGRGEFGALVSHEKVRNLKELKTLQSNVDRWLRPIGMTGFKEPLEMAFTLAAKMKNPTRSLFFMSDGYENQWPKEQVLELLKSQLGVKALFQAVTVVEYGMYADRAFLAQMAARMGGTLIHAVDFEAYQLKFEMAVQKKIEEKTHTVSLDLAPLHNLVWAIDDMNLTILTYESRGGLGGVSPASDADDPGFVIGVADGISNVFYLASKSVGLESLNEYDTLSEIGAYSALNVFATRCKPDIVYALLYSLADNRFINMYTNCFGKQAYSAFMEEARLAVFNQVNRYRDGRGYAAQQAQQSKKSTVLDILKTISANDDCTIKTNFQYSRIGLKMTDKNELFTHDEQAEIGKLNLAMAEATKKKKSVKEIKTISDKLEAILSSKQPPLKFQENAAEKGYPVSLVFNEERPNVSIRVCKEGTVDLSSRNPDPDLKLPATIQTKQFRSYTVVKDGLLNIEKLSGYFSKDVLAKLRKEENLVVYEDMGGGAVLDLSTLPLVNRKQVNEASARQLFETEYYLTCAKAAQKVYNYFANKYCPERRTRGLAETYGAEAATWLASLGITDGGFNPPVMAKESTDVYFSKEMKVKLKGYSSLPSITDLEKMFDKKKFTVTGELMKMPYEICQSAKDKLTTEKFSQFIESEKKRATTEVRQYLFEKSQIQFAVIIGQIWFKEFASMDENSMSIEVSGKKIDGKIEMTESAVRI